MAMLPRGGSGSGSGGDGSGGCCGPEEININMTGCCDGDGGGGESGGGGGGGVSVHNELDGLQGGKSGEYYHLTEAEYRRLPIRPVVMSPKNGAAGVNQVPQIVGSPYAHPYDVPMRAKHCQIATDAAFSNVVWEEEAFSASVVWQVLLKPDNTPYVQPNTKYFVRIRYQDRLGRWSDWSEASAFTTMMEFPESVILTPVMILPADGGQARAIDPILAMSSPKVIAGSANFDAADWQVSNDQSWASTLYSAEGTEDLTVHQTEGLNLATALGLAFYARGRQRTSTGEWSLWSVPARFDIRPEYEDLVFGLRKIFSKKYGTVFVFNIDQEGNVVSIPPKYWDNHPLYAFPKQVINVTGQRVATDFYVAFVPPCWMKYRVYDNDDGDMVIDMWYSPTPQTGDGWRLDMAFTRCPNGFYHCRYMPRTGGIYNPAYLGDGATSAVTTNHEVNQFPLLMNASTPRVHMWTIYERRLLLDLMMAEYATLDATRISTGSGASNTASAFCWRDFVGLIYGGGDAANGMAFDGIRQTDVSAESVDKITVMTPDGGNWTPYDVSLALGENMYATDILRGYSDVMGFDVALLGIVSRTAPNSGQTTSPWGMKASLTIAANNDAKGFYRSSDQDGLFAVGSHGARGSYFRVSMRADEVE